MYKKLLVSFIIGSSVFTVILHWIGLYKYLKNKIAYENKNNQEKFKIYSSYIFLSTIYYGITNVIISYLRIKYKINIHIIYFVISLISATLVISHNLYFKILWDSYKFENKDQKIIYGITVFMKHFINYNFIIKGLEMYINNI